MFSGLSTLRAGERKVEKRESESDSRLREYLRKQYGAEGGGEGGGKRKKKRKKAPGSGAVGVVIVDEDLSGFSAAKERAGPSELEPDEDDYQPVVVNAEGAERAKRLIEKEKERYKIQDDGSGWRVDSASRKKRRHDSPDLSPPRRGQRNDSPDLSPPRRGKRNDSPDLSPPRKGKRNESPDLSPPRKGKRNESPDLSPPRSGQRNASPDLSPPRRGQRNDSSDPSPPRKGKRNDSPDLSPPRRGKRNDSLDLTPPRRGKSESNAKKSQMMSDGTAAGMISGKHLKQELERKKMVDQKRFREMDAGISGRNAETVYRDRSGKKYSSRAEYLETVDAEKKEKEKKHMTEEELEWGGGMKQKKQKEVMREVMAVEAAKPFARGKDDKDLDSMQRDKLRWGDPMAHLVAKRTAQTIDEQAPALVDEKNKKAMKKSGFIIPQEVPQHSWLRRGVGAPPNRYSIRPGRHWDGVDRSNGFETKMWKEQHKQRAKDNEAFMFLQSDM